MLGLNPEEYLLNEVDSNIEQNLQDEVVQEAMKTGVDLREYSQEVEKELREVENLSIQDYINESRNIASLHNQITNCDEVLKRMEDMLVGFQSDLGSISSEIVSLQHLSVEMSQKLQNRQSVRGELSQFVDDIVVPEQMINHILETPTDKKEFMEQLVVLEQKISFLKEQGFKDVRACQDVRDIIEKLKFRALAKIREYLLQKIYSFRKPMTNYQIPQNAMLKHKSFFKFLLANDREIAREVRDEYVDTVMKIYYSYFKSYSSRLMKLQFEEAATKEDLLGSDEHSNRGLFSKPSLKNKSSVFTLGSRSEVLSDDLDAPCIIPHTAQRSETKYSFEALFRSLQYTLVDNTCREYLFICEFFIIQGPPAHDLFHCIFGKTLAMFLKQVDMYVQDCYDSVALFLCVHLVHRYQHMCTSRGVTPMQTYWENLQEMLWPRFEYVVQLNIHSIRDCDPPRLGAIDQRPHYITRRYAEFAAAITAINESFHSERVTRLMVNLQEEFENLLLKMAALFPARKAQLIFLINNYDMILSVVEERTREDSKESESFKEHLSARTSDYVEEILAPHFGGIMQFVKEAENQIERGQSETLRKEEGKVQTLVHSFSATWKKSLDDVQKEVLTSFPNFKNGTQILQQSLTQLVQYYLRFQKILSQPPLKTLPVRNELVNIHHLMVEVKKYKSNF